MKYRSFYQPLKQVIAWTAVSAVLFSSAMVSAADGGAPSIQDLPIPELPQMPSGPAASAPSASAAAHSPPETWEPPAQIPEVESATGAASHPNSVEVDPGTVSTLPAPTYGGVVDVQTLPITIVNPNAPAQVHDQGYIDDNDPMPSEGGTDDSASSDPGNGTPQEFPLPNAGTQVANFPGIGPTGSFPPDTEIAHGTRWIVEGVNRGFAVYDMRGNVTTAYTSYSTLFAANLPSGWAGSLFDPRVIYDRTSGKFIQLVIGVDFTNQTSYTFLAISNTGDPNGSWIRWRITNNAGTGGLAWMDYVTLGVDENGIYFSGNLFNFAGGYLRSDMYIYPIDLLTGTGVGGWRFSSLTWPAGAGGGAAFSLQAADPHIANSNDEAYMVNTYSGSGTRALLWTISGNRVAGGAAPTLTRASINVAAYHAIGNNVDQPGTATDIDGGDSRIQNAIYANRRVWAAITTADSAGGTNRSRAKVMSFNSDADTLDWETTWGAGTGTYVYYPAITVRGTSTSGPVGMYHSYSTATTHASSTWKVFDDPEDGIFTGTWAINRTGSGPYVRVFSGRNRFGDYSGADYDFTCPGRMWGGTEYAAAGNTWGTQIHGAMMDNSSPCPLGRPIGTINQISPAAGSSSTDTTPTYSWSRDPDAENYRLYVIRDGSSTATINTLYTPTAAGCGASGTCSITPSTALALDGYRWWVRAENRYGAGSYFGPTAWTVGGGTGSTAPTLIGPTGITTDTTPTITWTGGVTDTFYFMLLYGPAGREWRGWITAAQASCVGADTSCRYTPTTYETGESFMYYGRHYAYMLAYNGILPLSPYTGPMQFDVSAPVVPPATTTLTPSGAGGDNTPTYRWNASPTSTAYLLYVANGGGGIITTWYSHITAGCVPGTGVCAVTPTLPVPSGNAIWYVKTYNPQGQGFWSSGRTFSVP